VELYIYLNLCTDDNIRYVESGAKDHINFLGYLTNLLNPSIPGMDKIEATELTPAEFLFR